MAEAVLKLGTPTEEDETSISVIRVSNETKTEPKRSTTTIKDLESKMADMEKRVDDKFDRLLSSIESLKGNLSIGGLNGQSDPRVSDPLSDNEPSGLRRPFLSLENSLDGEFGVPSYARDDVLSLQPSTRERTGLKMFWAIAIMILQVHPRMPVFRVLLTNVSTSMLIGKTIVWALFLILKIRIKVFLLVLFWINLKWTFFHILGVVKTRLSCYKEEYRTAFPVHSESFLQVPGLDDLIEPMLQKRHGSKAVRSWEKGRQLHTQPLKAIESVGFQGQMASRMGIIAMAYMQQDLGSLMSD